MTATWMSGPAPGRTADSRRPAEHHHPVVWYVVAGALTTALQELLFVGARPLLGALTANVVAIALTTIANTEFQRRVTFAGISASPVRLHLQSVGTFAFYAGYGSLVLVSLHLFTAEPSATLQAVALAVTSGLGGILRFALLRWWVFDRG
ncbi:GtrA domain-containing protein [Amycolatopsis thermophila]|uniref:Flippase GtrA n=1 Tax=Amycolatopsis thermophila TaxID=206084 RepID=A0ABU0EWE1_9PSEU|nr:GtrA family protein [Amycolatopsis thermophila]MDQ0379621.1 putative flippase GtrA [Amycolatopsis thermophila]